MNGVMKGMILTALAGLAFFIFSGFAYSNDEVNIGLTMPLTGRAAAIGIDARNGAMVAAKEINDEGGLLVAGKRYKVTIQAYDDEGTPAKSVAGMHRLKEKHNVPAIIQNLSGPVMSMLAQNERLGVLLIGHFKHPDACARGNKLVLRHQKTAEVDAMQLAEGVVRILKAKTYALISSNDDYGKSGVAAYELAFNKLGVKQAAKEWLDQRTQTDFRGQLVKIKAANPDVILLTAYDEASAGVIKQAKELSINKPFVLSSGFGTTAEKLTGPDLIEGYMRTIEYTGKLPAPPGVARFKNELYPAMGYKEPVSGFTLNSYASVHVIARAMQKAGTTTDAFKIRQAVPLVLPLPEKNNTTGITGFLETGEGIIPGEIGKFQKGKLVSVQ